MSVEVPEARVRHAPVEVLAELLGELAARRVLIVCGQSRRFVERVEQALAGFTLEVFAEARRHVPKAVVERASAKLSEFQADTIVALGGGSATGLGKALRLEHDVHFVAVPTTYSGSEYTSLYGITDNAHKRTGRDPRVRPDFVVCDTSLTLDMPLGLSVASLLNAVAHPLLSGAGGPAPGVRPEAVRALTALLEALETLLVDPTSKLARQRAFTGVELGARAIESGVFGAHHELVHKLGGRLSVEHSALHSILLPHSLRALGRQRPEWLAELSEVLDVPDLEALLFDYLVRGGCPTALKTLGLGRPELEPELEASEPDTRQVVGDAYHGRRPSLRTRREDFGLSELVSVRGPELEACRRVVLCIHGRGSSADAILQAALEIVGDDPEVTLVAPQARDNTWYEKRHDQSRRDIGKPLENCLADLKRLSRRLLETKAPAELVLFGFSQGACLVLELFVELGLELGAVVALSGARIGLLGEGPRPTPALGATPVLLGKSQEDAWLSTAEVERIAAELQQVGCRVQVENVAGAGHAMHARQRLLGRALLRGREEPARQGGFGGFHASEDLPGALPRDQNSPYPVPYGLCAEQVNATGFSVKRVHNQRAWLYRVRPSAQLRALSALAHPCLCSDFEGKVPEPNLTGFAPLELPLVATDFVDGLVTLGGAGSAKSRRGFAIHLYTANRSMEERAFSSADGSLLLVPELGRLTLLTELGVLELAPGSVAVLPPGLRFSVLLRDAHARGYLGEVFASRYELAERGPIGANGLADARHFEAPSAWHEDRLSRNFEIVIKSGGQLYRASQDYSPFDVAAWHGNYAPYVYDLAHFTPVANVRFDHVDPSVYTVLSAPLDEPGTNNLDFVVFVPRWDPTEHTFRPPYYHRNVTCEFNGIIRQRGGGPFAQGASFVTPSLVPHGVAAHREPPSLPRHPLPASAPAPHSLWFQFETSLPLALTAWAEAHRVADWRSVWGGYRSRFRTDR